MLVELKAGVAKKLAKVAKRAGRHIVKGPKHAYKKWAKRRKKFFKKNAGPYDDLYKNAKGKKGKTAAIAGKGAAAGAAAGVGAGAANKTVLTSASRDVQGMTNAALLDRGDSESMREIQRRGKDDSQPRKQRSAQRFMKKNADRFSGESAESSSRPATLQKPADQKPLTAAQKKAENRAASKRRKDERAEAAAIKSGSQGAYGMFAASRKEDGEEANKKAWNDMDAEERRSWQTKAGRGRTRTPGTKEHEQAKDFAKRTEDMNKDPEKVPGTKVVHGGTKGTVRERGGSAVFDPNKNDIDRETGKPNRKVVAKTSPDFKEPINPRTKKPYRKTSKAYERAKKENEQTRLPENKIAHVKQQMQSAKTLGSVSKTNTRNLGGKKKAAKAADKPKRGRPAKNRSSSTTRGSLTNEQKRKGVKPTSEIKKKPLPKKLSQSEKALAANKQNRKEGGESALERMAREDAERDQAYDDEDFMRTRPQALARLVRISEMLELAVDQHGREHGAGGKFEGVNQPDPRNDAQRLIRNNRVRENVRRAGYAGGAAGVAGGQLLAERGRQKEELYKKGEKKVREKFYQNQGKGAWRGKARKAALKKTKKKFARNAFEKIAGAIMPKVPMGIRLVK